MSEYKAENSPVNQERIVDGVCINPLLRPGFDSTKHSDRSDMELTDWWGRAYILEREYQPSDDSYSAYVQRITSVGADLGFTLQTESEWLVLQKKSRGAFLASYPLGKAYTVKILNSDSWDRSTSKGSYPTLEDALINAE